MADWNIRADLLHILQHALGLDEYGRGTGYRNHCVADEGSDDYAACRSLEELGYVVAHAPREIFGGATSWCFTVTDLGRERVRADSPRPPRLTRSQERYRRFLRADCGLSFREWLRLEGANRG